jgi:hypothetical protein
MFITLENGANGDWKCGNVYVATSASTWWNRVLANPEDKKAFSSVPYMKCPTRRPSGEQLTEGRNYLSGPTTDYAIVTAAGPGTGWSGATDTFYKIGMGLVPWDATRSGTTRAESVSYCHGPFRAALIMPDWTSHSSYQTTPNIAFGISSWTGRYDMAAWSDGTSNQLIFGEKKIPFGKINACSRTDASGIWNLWDCSYMSGALDYPQTMLIRSFDLGNGANPYGVDGYIPIALANDSLATAATDRACFGSWHPGICNFTLGDGSVRAVSVTTPPESILYPLARVDDGVNATIP